MSFTIREGINHSSLGSTSLYLTSTTAQNINALATDNKMLWDTHTEEWGLDVLHRTIVDLDKITILAAATYELSASVAFDAQSSSAARYNGILRFRLNGTTDFGPQGKSGYIRDVTGHDESSLHVQTFPVTLARFDYIHLKVDRESDPTGTINTTPGASALYIRRIA